LPVTQRCVLDGRRFLMVHGTPRDPLDEYVMRDADTWAKRLVNAQADVVCVGHTHMQFNLMIGSTLVLNPGSVGQPRDGDPRSAYAIIDGSKVELKRIAYPIDETIAKFDSLPVPDRAKHMFRDALLLGRLTNQRAASLTAMDSPEDGSH
jgi:predicted phosphodiesterase